MQINFPTLIIEINDFEFAFFVGDNNSESQFQIIFKDSVLIKGNLSEKISDQDMVLTFLKKKIYLIEQKFNIVFKEVILIVDNFNCSLINFSGFKKLNGSQLKKNDITYILNSLKSKINEIENKKTILHIFNSKYILDGNHLNNLPIGLFGNFYSHELSFFLINSNECKNLENIFLKSNLKVKKILSKSFIEGSVIVNNNSDFETFVKIELGQNFSKILFFENAALKYIENFKFGTDLILNDISKIIGLNTKMIKNILASTDFTNQKIQGEIIDQKFFAKQNFRKIKKKLIFDIASARIEEMTEVIFLKNINFSNFIKKTKIPVFVSIHDKSNINCFKEKYVSALSKNSESVIKFVEKIDEEKLCECAASIVQYGWKKEAVPIVLEKKSLIGRIFHKMFS